MSNLTDFIGHNIIRSATEPTDKTKFWFNETDFKLHYYDYTNLAWVETTKQYITPTISVFDIFGDNSAVSLYQLDGNALDTGGAYNGILGGSATFSNGKYGQCVTNNAAEDRNNTVILSSSGIPQISDGDIFSLSMWIKIPQTSTTTTVLNIFTATTGYSQANCGNRKRMITFDSRNTPSYDIQYMEQPDGGTACQSGQPIVSFGITPDNTWHNIVVVKNGTSIITYTDGVQKNSSTGGYTGKTGMNNVTILGEGGSSFNNDVRAKGNVDQVRIFNRALTATEVNTLYTEV